MKTKRFALLLLFSLFACSPAAMEARAQQAFVSGGALVSDAPAASPLEGTALLGEVGVRYAYTDLFTLQASYSYGGLSAVEGEIQFHPFESFSVGELAGVNPYGYLGYGYYIGGGEDGERGVAPLGIGVELPVSEVMSILVEVGGRWTLAENNPPRSLDLFSGVAPSVGFAFNIDNLPSDEDYEEPLVVEEVVEEEEEDEGPAFQQGSLATGPATKPLSGSIGGLEVGSLGRLPMWADTTDYPALGMVELPAGSFIMGLTDEDPLSVQQAGRKRISLVPFLIDKREVTNGEYREYLNELSSSERSAATPDETALDNLPSRLNWKTYFRGETYSNYPVVGVTYDQAEGYCQFYGKRLPTEAEWEYAARGGLAGGVYPWPGYEPRTSQGRYLANYNPQRGGYAADGFVFTAPVETYPANFWGLYNVSGNVAEWIEDKWHPSYSQLSDFNPLYTDESAEDHVIRGGSWDSNTFYIGVGVRDRQPGSEASPEIGFRCVQDPDAGFVPVPTEGGPADGGDTAQEGPIEGGPAQEGIIDEENIGDPEDDNTAGQNNPPGQGAPAEGGPTEEDPFGE